MLNFVQTGGGRDCSGFSRRDFLRVGSLGLGGLALPSLLAAKGGSFDEGYVRDKSVVLLYLSGGASQIETFDPKMDAPMEYRSVNGEVKTKLPGVTFGGSFPRLAAMADKLAVVRSHAHKVGDHEKAHIHVLSGGTDPVGNRSSGFSIGSCYSRLRGTNHPDTGLPTYITLNEAEVDRQYTKEFHRFNKGSWSGSLGRSYGPFPRQVGWGAEAAGKTIARNNDQRVDPGVANMTLNLPPEIFENRRRLLDSIDAFRRRLDGSKALGTMDKLSSQAVSMLLGGATRAFDLGLEDPRLVEKYDTSHIKIGHSSHRPSTLGKQMLLARRLCESGAGFVSVHSAGWDMHADSNNPGMVKGMAMLGPTMDQAVSAFLEDVEQRGLSEKILLVITGDFGRTPKIGKGSGRDHWANLCPLVFAGGGLQMGQVIGRSNAKAEKPATRPITPGDMMTTILHTVFDVGKMRLDSTIPRVPGQLVLDGTPIKELF